MANGWTAERRAKQAQPIRQWKPWEHSTGATTAQGKAISSQNAYKGNVRGQIKAIREILKAQSKQLEDNF